MNRAMNTRMMDRHDMTRVDTLGVWVWRLIENANEDIGDAQKDNNESNDSDDDKGEKEEKEGMELEKEDSDGRHRGVLAVQQRKSARRGVKKASN